MLNILILYIFTAIREDELSNIAIPMGFINLKFSEIFVGILLWYMLRNKYINRRSELLQNSVVMFIDVILFMQFVALVVGLYYDAQFKQLMGYFKLVSTILVAYFCFNNMKDANSLWKILTKLLQLSTLLSAFALVEYVLETNIFTYVVLGRIYDRATQFTLLMLFISTGVLLSNDALGHERKSRTLLLANIITTSLVFVFTFARSAWGVSAVGVLFVYGVVTKASIGKFIKLGIVTAMAFGALLVVGDFIGMNVSERIGARFDEGVSDVENKEGSYEQRMMLLEGKMWRTMRDFPVFGRGFSVENSSTFLGSLDDASLSRDSGIGNLFIVYGFFGIGAYAIAFLLSIIYAIRFLFKTQTTIQRVLLASSLANTMAMLFIMFFSDVFFMRPSLLALYLGWGVELVAIYDIIRINRERGTHVVEDEDMVMEDRTGRGIPPWSTGVSRRIRYPSDQRDA